MINISLPCLIWWKIEKANGMVGAARSFKFLDSAYNSKKLVRYKYMVRSHLSIESAVQPLFPYLRKEIDLVESVQKRATVEGKGWIMRNECVFGSFQHLFIVGTWDI